VDPLSIKRHLAETEKYLAKSKSIRDQVMRERDRTYSMAYNNKASTQRTPEHYREGRVENKMTSQTKLVWSNY
jgi:hypothetical protein